MRPSAPPGDRLACLNLTSDQDEHKHPRLVELSHHGLGHAHGQDRDVDSGFATYRNMVAPHERHQQVHRDRAACGTITHLTDRIAKLVRGRQAQRAEAAGGGDGSGHLGARQPAAHAGLGDRNIQAKAIK